MTQNMAMTTLSLLGREALHLGAGAIGALGAIGGSALALVTLFISRRVPHHRAATSAAWGMGALAVALLVLASAPSFPVLVAGVLLLGVGGGMAMPGLLNAVASQAGHQRERVIALYTVTLSISLAAGPLLETLVLALAHQAVRVPYVVFVVFPLAGAGLALWVGRERASRPIEEGPAEEPSGSAVVAQLPTGELAAVEPAKEPGPEGRGAGRARGRSGLLATRSGQIALVTELLYGVPFAGITVFGALVARVGFGFSPAKAQLGFTVFFVASFIARGAVAWRAPIVRKRSLLTLAALLTGGGLLLLGLGPGSWALFLAMGLLGIPHGLTFPLALALVAEATPLEDLPRANASLLGSGNMLSVIVPLVLGGVIPEIGYRYTTLVMLGPVLVFTAVYLVLAARRPARAAQVSP